jgi:uncharacterized membrane protein
VRTARLLLAAAALAWIVVLAAAPSAALGVPVSGLTYAAGSLVCHQRPERSFHLGLAQLPVCARCSGLYLGAALAAVAALRGGGLDALAARGAGPSRRAARLAIAVAAVPTVATWVAEAAGVWAPANVTRFVAALPLGAAVAATLAYAAAEPPPLR